MRWRILTAAVLIFILLAGGWFLQRTVAHACGEIESMLRQAKSDLRPEGVEAARVQWESKLPLLSCVVAHDRLERVGEGLARAEGYLRAGERADFAAQIEAVLYLLDDIREYDHINLQTLL